MLGQKIVVFSFDLLEVVEYFRAVPLPEEIIDKVEDEMPTTPTLLEAKYSVLPELETSFQKFFKVFFPL